MNTGERIKTLRKELELTLEKFGEKIGLKKSALSLIENGKSNLTAQTATSICREFNVNEEWLRNGVGEMFNTSSGNQALDELKKEFNLDDFSVKLIKAFSELTDEQRASVKDFIENLGDLTGENEKTVEELETEYKKALGFAPSTSSSASSTTGEKEA